ncbi:877_t:CDS:1 [Ambispora leptoticha]|uniref:877_t:CDS:1 n=1 Tax=Ambispora leptoticha TaxID=144679 RepID=A0A9N8W9D4_9GLOM|nr:877_t:CDS:1 [Ambispora leptoticha]
MLNKIKIVGKILPIELKNKEEKDDLILYFSLLVPSPSNSSTILRCVAQGENAKKIEVEVKKDEILEVKGYLRNEKSGRQILVKVIEFTKIDKTFDTIDKNSSNQLRLLGKIITDFKIREDKEEAEVLSFRITVPREGNDLPIFFCRVQGTKLIKEIRNKLKKNDIILLEGFLQTKKIVEEEKSSEIGKKISRISSIICQKLILLDNDSVNVFYPLNQFTHIVGKVEKIDFTKPKEK